ncbi:hypothetical protein P3T20_003777 [Paraburkholderia sp. GAS206C]|uniref:Uncharacterized protein n=1 Tax=Paraburkholderia phenazinium TaxID=60549 RepID=A0A1N6H9F5_9BURK|nr:hypothetical protein SAMN05444168_3098 [Paraburkholderia phenazinium]
MLFRTGSIVAILVGVPASPLAQSDSAQRGRGTNMLKNL